MRGIEKFRTGHFAPTPEEKEKDPNIEKKMAKGNIALEINEAVKFVDNTKNKPEGEEEKTAKSAQERTDDANTSLKDALMEELPEEEKEVV